MIIEVPGGLRAKLGMFLDAKIYSEVLPGPLSHISLDHSHSINWSAIPTPLQLPRPSSRWTSVLLQLDHHVRNLDVLILLVLSRDLEDDVLLVVRYGLLADVLDELAHSALC
jgi:hypothetical protein